MLVNRVYFKQTPILLSKRSNRNSNTTNSVTEKSIGSRHQISYTFFFIAFFITFFIFTTFFVVNAFFVFNAFLSFDA